MTYTTPADFNTKQDSLSQLIQLHAKKAGLDKVRFTGRGREDLDALCLFASNADLLGKSLWNGLKELMEMKENHELPEPMQAKICSIVLTARTYFELSLEKRNEKALKVNTAPPPGSSLA